MKKRILSMVLSLVLVLGMLPGTVLAADCAHETVENGVCIACEETVRAAVINDVYYNTFEEAVTAANAAGAEADEDAASPIHIKLLKDTAVAADREDAVVLTKGKYKLDLGAFILDLGKTSLEIAADADLTVTGGTIKTASEVCAVKNSGALLLENVTVDAQQAAHGLVNAGEAAEAAIQSGSITGKTYGVGLEGGAVVLAVMPVTTAVGEGEGEESEPVNNDPKIKGDTASFAVTTGEIQLTAALTEGTAYSVDKKSAGVFARGDEGVALNAAAFTSVNAEYTVALKDGALVMQRDLAGQFTVTDKEFTYNGKKQVPTVTPADEALKEGTAYAVSYSRGGEAVTEPVKAGDYTVSIKGLNGNSVDQSEAFTIKKAQPTMSWAQEAESLVYAGKAASLSTKVNVTLLEGETFSGEITYSYRKGGGAYAAGLPTDVGTYEVKAAIAASENYLAAETATPLKLTVTKLTVTNPEIILTAPQNGYVYTGSAVEPKVTVKEGAAEIAPGFYTVAYSNNVNVGTATVTIAPSSSNVEFVGELAKTFEVEKAEQVKLTIGGVPAALTYGDAAFQLTATGGNTEGVIVWTVVDGKDVASVTTDGLVTINGAGKFTVQATKGGDDSFKLVDREVEITVAPKALTVSGATATAKTYDGKKTVPVTAVQLEGIVGSDDVKVDVSGLQGEVSAANAGSYDKVTLPALTLGGDAASKYTLTQPTQAVPAAVTINKAKLPAALTEINKTVTLGTESVSVDALSKGMPTDAGTLSYANGTQSIGDGDSVVVMSRDVSADGVLKVGFVNAKAGDKIICEVLIGSQNYETAKLTVNIVMETMKVDSSKATIGLDNSTFTYDGKEHKPKVTVKVDGLQLTEGTHFDVGYPTDTKSVGDKQLTITFKGDYSGSLTAKYTVNKAKLTVTGTKADNKTFDGTTKATVKVGTLNGVVSGDTVTVSAAGTFDNKNSGYSKTVTVTYTLGGKDAGKYELESKTATVKANISAHTTYYYSNLLATMSTSNVDSGDKSTLQAVVNDINMILTDDSLSSANRTTFSNLQAKARDYLARIDSAAAAVSTNSVRSVEKITPATVKLTDQSTLTKAQSELNNAMNTYKGNYTTEEQKRTEAQLKQVTEALAVLERVQTVEEKIDALSASSTAEDVAAVRNAYEALSTYEKSLVTNVSLNKLEEAEGGPLTTPQVTPNANEDQPQKDEEQKDTVKFPFGAIIIVAVVACGGVAAAWFVLQKKREDEANW